MRQARLAGLMLGPLFSWPGWVLVAASALAWAALLSWLSSTPDSAALCRSQPANAAWVNPLLHWIAMTVAMMFPTLGRHVCYLREHTLQHRFPRGLFLFLAATVAIWVALSPLLEAAAGAIVHLLDADRVRLALVAAGAVLIWQGTGWRQGWINRGHVFPSLAAFGLPADVASVRFGVRAAAMCAAAAWPVMLVPLLFRHDLVLTALVTIYLVVESNFAGRFASRTPVMLVAGVLALACAMLVS